MEKVRRFFLNLSVRKSIILYIAISVFIALFFSVLTSNLCRAERDRIYAAHADDGERYYLTNERGERLGEGTFINELGIPMLTEAEQRKIAILDMVVIISIPFFSMICVLSAVLLFYRNKLKTPLAILGAAHSKISENDLDFFIDYASKDEMGRLCQSFDTMRLALSQNNKKMWRQMEERKRLNAAFAHDLRTPLTVLKGYLEILQSGDNAIVRADTLSTISRHIARMERYVESMNSLQKLDDITPNYHSVDMTNFVDSVKLVAALLCETEGKDMSFTNATSSKAAKMDAEIVSRVIENIVTNAARFAKSRISIEISELGNVLSVLISDDGNGFSTESLEKATDPYYTEDENKGMHFGLGLYICQMLCKHHSGGIQVRNTDSGAQVEATFKITSPSR